MLHNAFSISRSVSLSCMSLNLSKIMLATCVFALMGVSGCQQLAFEGLSQSKSSVANTYVGKPMQLQIEPLRVACDSQVPMQCLQAIDVVNQRAFLIWYDAIDGFKHDQGMRYVIQARPVRGRMLDDPSAQQWVLDSVVSQTPVAQ